MLAMRIPEEVKQFFRKQGKIGAKKRSANLSAERRSEIARRAAEARWTKAQTSKYTSERIESMTRPTKQAQVNKKKGTK